MKSINYKVCGLCKVSSKLDDFYLHNKSLDGRQNTCKKCRRKASNDSMLKRKAILKTEDCPKLLAAQKIAYNDSWLKK